MVVLQVIKINQQNVMSVIKEISKNMSTSSGVINAHMTSVMIATMTTNK